MAGKAKLLKALVDRAKAGDDLAMDHLSRMARAKEQGFDVSRPVYHGTKTDFNSFDSDRAIGTNFWSTTDKAAIESGDVGAQGSGTIKEMYQRIENPAGWKEYDKFGTDELIARGYDGLGLPDPDGNITYSAFSPNQYRDVNAAFDPAKRESSNLLASLAPMAVGAGALMQSDDSDAGVVGKAIDGGSALAKKINAWHGTPHDFPPTANNPLGEFKSAQIGTGEGAQAYGHGLYFGGSRKTGEGYRKNIGTQWNHLEGNINGAASNDFSTSLPDDERKVFDAVYTDVKEAIDRGWVDDFDSTDDLADLVRGRLDDPNLEIYGFDGQPMEVTRDVASKLSNKINSVKLNPKKGSLYNVEIDATPDELLDWDKPLSEQPQIVKNAFDEFSKSPEGIEKARNYYSYKEGDNLSDLPEFADPQGETINNILGNLDDQKTFRKHGIKGIQYDDALSRGAGAGTKNYVVFDEKLINIANKYGVSMAVAATMAAGLTPEQAQAASEVPVESSMNDLLNYGQQQVMEIEETPWAENTANFIDKWTQTPIGSPLEGTSNYLRNLGRKRSALTKAADAFGLGMDFF